jgi:hypothetical protein
LYSELDATALLHPPLGRQGGAATPCLYVPLLSVQEAHVFMLTFKQEMKT